PVQVFTGLISRPRNKYAPRIILENDKIVMKNDMFSKMKSILLEDVKLIQLKPERVTVITKEFDFSHSFQYESLNKTEIMEAINNYAIQKDIPLEKVSYKSV
ncbi:MAG: hypothetical protein AAFY41_05725, partial [Bacteroidota bacterium]